MRQRLRSHLTYANVMVTILAFILLGGGTALASYVISSNSQVGPGTISGHKPPTGKHANIIGGSVNGTDVAENSLGGADINESSVTGNARALVYNADADFGQPPNPPKTIATVGPYAIKGQCVFVDGSPQKNFVKLYARGPAGTADYMFGQTEGDSSDQGLHSNGLAIPATADTLIAQTAEDFSVNSYSRIVGTAFLKSDTGTLVQVQFNAVADSRPFPPTCLIYGTATRAT
jgi:hypothetical protein